MLVLAVRNPRHSLILRVSFRVHSPTCCGWSWSWIEPRSIRSSSTRRDNTRTGSKPPVIPTILRSRPAEVAHYPRTVRFYLFFFLPFSPSSSSTNADLFATRYCDPFHLTLSLTRRSKEDWRRPIIDSHRPQWQTRVDNRHLCSRELSSSAIAPPATAREARREVARARRAR